jgi:hypothetical protein
MKNTPRTLGVKYSFLQCHFELNFLKFLVKHNSNSSTTRSLHIRVLRIQTIHGQQLGEWFLESYGWMNNPMMQVDKTSSIC